jgi:hypothetical protein
MYIPYVHVRVVDCLFIAICVSIVRKPSAGGRSSLEGNRLRIFLLLLFFFNQEPLIRLLPRIHVLGGLTNSLFYVLHVSRPATLNASLLAQPFLCGN